MTAQLWVAILGGAAVGQLINAAVTTLLARRGRTHEHQRWLLDNRLEAYFAYQTAYVAWQRSRSSEDRPGQLLRLGDLIAETNRHVIIAPPETAQLAGQAVDAAMEVARGGDDEGTAVTRFGDAVARLTVQQRVDLEATTARSRRQLAKALRDVDAFRAGRPSVAETANDDCSAHPEQSRTATDSRPNHHQP